MSWDDFPTDFLIEQVRTSSFPWDEDFHKLKSKKELEEFVKEDVHPREWELYALKSRGVPNSKILEVLMKNPHLPFSRSQRPLEDFLKANKKVRLC